MPNDNLDDPASAGPSTIPTRIARACENCRARRIKCTPPYPCAHCREVGLNDCRVREKARPTRTKRSYKTPSGPSKHGRIKPDTVRAYPIVESSDEHEQGPSSDDCRPGGSRGPRQSSILGSTFDTRTNFIGMLERDLGSVYFQLTGQAIDLSVNETHNHQNISLETPLPALPLIDHEQGLLAILAFNRHMLPFCSYLTEARSLDLYHRYSDLPRSLSPDLLALVFACLALGFLRLKSFQTTDHTGRPIPNQIPNSDSREDVAFFRHAIHELRTWGSVSFISLQALSVLQFYSMCTSCPESTRQIVSWMVSQTRELGIHRTETSVAYSPGDRADLMMFLVLFLDGQYATLCARAPLLRHGEFDVNLIQTRQFEGGMTSAGGLVPRQSLAELVLLQSEMHEKLYDQTTHELSLDWVLSFQAKWAQWVAAFVRAQRTTGNAIVDSFVAIHWQWDRIMLWSACLRDDRLSCTSWAGLARGAIHIISKYRNLYTTASYNFVWTHLRRIITSAHLVMLCYWRCELEKGEAEQALCIALYLLELSSTRWPSAVPAKGKIETVAKSLSLQLSLELAQDTEYPDHTGYIVPGREAAIDESVNDPMMLLFEQSFINPDPDQTYAYDVEDWVRGTR